MHRDRLSKSLAFFWATKIRRSCPEVFCKKGVLRNFANFTAKHLCQNLFLNNVADLRPATLFKKRLWHRCFLVSFAKFLRTSFLTKHLWWLLLINALQELVLNFQVLHDATGIYLFKVNNGNSKKMCEICSNLIIKTPGRLVSSLLTLNRFHTFSCCFYWRIWTSECRLEVLEKLSDFKYLLTVAIKSLISFTIRKGSIC